MPELPEAERVRRLVERYCVGQKIREINVREQGGGSRQGLFDDKILVPPKEGQWTKSLVGKTIQSVERLGKRILLRLSRSRSVVISLGMTGSITVQGVKALEYRDFRVRDETWPPKWTKLELVCSNDIRCAYTDSRRFGKLEIVPGDPYANCDALTKLAPDPLDARSLPSPNEFAEKLRSKRIVLKSALLDQNFVLCGLGNWLVDDICLEARIPPNALCSTLLQSECFAVLHAAVNICSQAVRANAESSLFPKEWLFHIRWNAKKKGKSTTLRTTGGNVVRVCDCAGRTTLWVPSLQKRHISPQDGASADKSAARISNIAPQNDVTLNSKEKKKARKKAAGHSERPSKRPKRRRREVTSKYFS